MMKICAEYRQLVQFAAGNHRKLSTILERCPIDAKQNGGKCAGATTTLLSDGPSPKHLTISDLSGLLQYTNDNPKDNFSSKKH